MSVINRDDKGRIVQIISQGKEDEDLAEILRIVEQNEAARRLRFVAEGISFPPDKMIQRLVIAAGTRGTVYRYDLTQSGLTAFIRVIGCPWWADTLLYFQVDGDIKETVVRTIGHLANPIGNPWQLTQPIVARKLIEWIAVNNDVVPHTFEVICDGHLYLPHVADQLHRTYLFGKEALL